MKTAILFCAGLFLSIPAHAQSQSEAVSINDFAYKSEIILPPGDGLARFDLTDQVYAHIEGQNLEDLRVFNAQGDAVPYLIWQQKPGVKKNSKTVNIPFFPILSLDEVGVMQKLTTTQVANKTVSEETLRKLYEEKLDCFLLDARAVSGSIATLHFEFGEIKKGYLYQMTLEGSDDLQHWVTVLPKTAVGKFYHFQEVLMHDTLTLPPSQFAYYRIVFLNRFGDKLADKFFSGISAEVVDSQELSVPFIRKTVIGETINNNPSETHALYDLGGVLPIEEFDVETLAKQYYWKIHLYSASSRDATVWHDHGQHLIYRFKNTVDMDPLQSEPIRLRSRDRFWKVVFLAGHSMSANFNMAVSYRPETVVFLPQGEAPFSLAFGYKNLPPFNSDLANLLDLNDNSTDVTSLISAQLGEVLQQRTDVLDVNEAIQQKTEIQKQQQSWVVWVVLLAGVGFMGFMALSLFRQMNKK